MNIMSLLLLAQGAPKGPGEKSGGGGFFDPTTLMFIVLIFGVFYFFMIRPQKKRERERKDMLSRVGKGAQVRTIGGIYARVVIAKEKYVVVEVDKDTGTRLKLSRAAVSEILSEGPEEDEEES